MTTEVLSRRVGKTREDAKTRFLRASERAALIVEPGTRRQARLLECLLPGQATRPPMLPGRVLGLDAADRRVPVPGIEPVARIEQPANLYVAVLVERMEHHPEAGGGVPASWIFWDGDGPANLTEEEDGPYGYPLPGPGETLTFLYHDTIYQGLAVGGCSNGLPFPLGLRSWVVEAGGERPQPGDDEIGEVRLFDDSTIARAGFYDFWYQIRAGSKGGRSRFAISGSVLVQCTNENQL